MTNHSVTVTLSEPLYERVRITAEAAARPVEELLSQFIATACPLFDDDLPMEMRSEFAGWVLLSDTDLWEIAQSRFEETKQVDLQEFGGTTKTANPSRS